jgi:phosphate transport system protein
MGTTPLSEWGEPLFMSVHFLKELEKLRNMILAEGTLIQDNLSKAIDALVDRDLDAAERIVRADDEVDQMEIDVEENCLKILALHQPVANDLRFIVGVLKMNNDLERMGDIVANIAKRARFLARREPLAWPMDVEALAGEVRAMVAGALGALVAGDAVRARQVCAQDASVDRRKREMIAALRQMLQSDQERSPIILKMIDVPRHLERIADLATNIAEDVIYMVEGVIIRHGRRDEEES